MKKGLLFLGAFVAFNSFSQDCSDLFISEYVEGVGNNKALEIYNPTASAIDLSQYFVARLSNGNGIGSLTPLHTVQLTGTIAPYSTYVGVLDKRDENGTGNETPIWEELEALADGFYTPVYNDNQTWYWNGNDCVMLAKGNASNPNSPSTVLVDFFGKDGQNPENTTAGTNGWSSVAPYTYTSGNPMDRIVTEDHSMIRKTTVLKGKNSAAEVFGPSYVFNPLLEYDSIPALIPRIDPVTGDTLYQQDGVTPQWDGNWGTLGWHFCNCAPDAGIEDKTIANVLIYPNPSEGTFTLKGDFETVAVVNMLGQVVANFSKNIGDDLTITLNEQAGVYLVKVSNQNGASTTKRIIIK